MIAEMEPRPFGSGFTAGGACPADPPLPLRWAGATGPSRFGCIGFTACGVCPADPLLLPWLSGVPCVRRLARGGLSSGASDLSAGVCGLSVLLILLE